MTDDLRFDDEEKLQGVTRMFSAATALGKPVAMYAAEFRGAIVTVIGIQREPNAWVPAAIVLPDAEWADVKPMSQEMHVLKS